MQILNRGAALTFLGVLIAGCGSASDATSEGAAALESHSSSRGVGDTCWTKAQTDVQELSGHPAYVTSVVGEDEKYVVSTKAFDGSSVDYWVTFPGHDCNAYPSIEKLPSSATPPSEYDACRDAALRAVESQAGGGTDGAPIVSTIEDEKKYEVTVGLTSTGFSGVRSYWVTFPHGCSSIPTVEQVPVIVPALQGAAHDTYAAFLRANAYAFPAANAVNPSALTGGAKDAYDGFVAAQKEYGNVCSSLDAYELDVTGQKTFAVTCTVTIADIPLSISTMNVFDASGVLVDSGSFTRAPSTPAIEEIKWDNTSTEATAH